MPTWGGPIMKDPGSLHFYVLALRVGDVPLGHAKGPQWQHTRIILRTHPNVGRGGRASPWVSSYWQEDLLPSPKHRYPQAPHPDLVPMAASMRMAGCREWGTCGSEDCIPHVLAPLPTSLGMTGCWVGAGHTVDQPSDLPWKLHYV